MQEQWNEFISLVMAKPKALGEQRIAADIVDVSAAGESDDSAKETLQKTICELRKRKVAFVAAAGALTAAPGAYAKALGAFFDQSRVGKKWKRGKEEVRLFCCPRISSTSTPRSLPGKQREG